MGRMAGAARASGSRGGGKFLLQLAYSTHQRRRSVSDHVAYGELKCFFGACNFRCRLVGREAARVDGNSYYARRKHEIRHGFVDLAKVV